MADFYAAIDLGGTKTAVALFALDHKLLKKVVLATPSDEKEGLEVMTEAVEKLIKESGLRKEIIKGVGLCIPGFLDKREQKILKLPNLPNWNAPYLPQMLEEALKLPVVADNDANLAALGEFMEGSGQKSNPFIYLTISTGVGGGIILNGEILHGWQGFAAEVGHIVLKPDGPLCGCGQRGCWEALGSGTAIAKRAEEKVKEGIKTSLVTLEKITAKDVFEAKAQGDQLAKEVIEEAIFYSAQGIFNLVQIINPERIAVGGGISRAGADFFLPLQKSLDSFLKFFPAKVELSGANLDPDSGLIGSIYLLEKFLKN